MRKNILLAIFIAMVFHCNVWAATEIEKHWNCNPYLYPNTMTIIGVVEIDGVEQGNTSLEVGAFCGTECRGSEMLRYFSQVDRYLVFLTVYGEDNDAITFKLYDHGSEEELDAGIDGMTFEINAMHGLPSNPYVFNFIPYFTATVAANPAGAGTVTGGGRYLSHETVTLSASPNTGYTFLNWTENDEVIGSDPTLQFDIVCNRSILANFETIMHHVSVTANNDACGTVSGGGDYQEGSQVTVTATANTGFQFDRWTMDGETVSTNASYTFTIWEDVDLVACFVVQQIHINASASPSNGGSVTGAGIYDYGTIVALTAYTADGFAFDSWTENGNVVSSEPSYSFTAYFDRNLVAHFKMVLPELHVTSISHSDFYAGQQVSITWTVQNDGLVATPDGEVWYDRVWLSIENRVAASNNNSILLGEFVNLAALGSGEYYTQTQSFNIPLTLSGPYYLFVITDAYDCHRIFWEDNEVPLPYSPPPFLGALSTHGNRIYEQSEYDHGRQPGSDYHDNFFYDYLTIEVPPLADLQVTSVIAPNNIFSGTMASVLATISNLGGAHTNVSRWSDALFVSQSETFDGTAVHVGNVQHNGVLAPDESYEVILTGTIPLTWYGDVYFYVHTDIYGQVYEHVANDNNISRSQAVNVILSPPADLIPTVISIPSTVSTGERLAVSYTVINQGAGNPNSSSWRDKIYLSTHPDELVNPIELKTVTHYNGLAPNVTYTITESIALPSSLSAGVYYLYVVTDANNQVFEYIYDDNNTMRSSASLNVIKPDLVVTQIVSESTLTACYPASFSYTIQNIGEGTINNLSVTDRLYMSPNADMSNAVQLTSQTHSLTMSSQQAGTFNCNVQMPNLAEGTYYLFVQTDTGNAVNESNEGNNMLSFYPIMVLHQPLPDLIPVSFALPSEIQAGTIIYTEFNIANIGDMDLLNSNCAMNVYALQNGQQILCPMQTQSQPPMGNISIPINGSLHFNRTILVPANVTSACSSFVLKVDAQGTVTELDENNNTVVTISTVIDCPLPDLTVSNIVLPESVQAGATVTVSFDVNNVGEADLETSSLSVTVYANMNGDTTLCPLQSQIVPVQGETIQLEVGESIHFEQAVLVPPTIEPTCNQFTVTVDPNNTIFETNDNNNSNTVPANVMDYPFNLELQSIAFPTEITAGETYSVSWTVKNVGTCPTDNIPMYVNRNGNYYQAQSGNLPYPWVDKVYLSMDEVIGNNDICVCTRNRITVLNPDDSYTVTVSFDVPYSVVGNPYLIATTDCTNMTYDMERENNTLSQQVTVLLGDLPDLRIAVLDVEPVLTADQTYTISYEVVNEGEGVTRQDVWKDAFYLSNMDGILTGAFRLAEKTHQGVLAPGDTYEATVEVTIPSAISGDYFIIGFTDATSLVYEHDNENDNLLSTPVTVALPLPCDLTVVDPSYPSTAASGDNIIVSWTLFNIGNNPASGRIRDAVYLSEDNEWSSDDIMLGYKETNINLEANGQQNFEMTTTAQGVPQGSYYLIVKSNILHALNEASYDNNTCIGLSQVELDYPVLVIGSSVDRTMSGNQSIYYKIEVGPEYEQQTLSCQLTTTSLYPGNGLYISHRTVPSMSQFDFSASMPYEKELEILIPSLEQGDYYLLARGSAQDGQPQNITLSASIINFEILHVDADHGSNTGSLTTQVIGAKFDSIMDFRLVQGGDYMPAEKVFFSNSTESFVTFNLTDLQAGLYDMEAELPGGVITIKDGAFTVEEGLPAELSVNIIAPSSVRSGNTFTVNIEYGNIGTTDLNVSGLLVVSNNGHPIGLTSEDLGKGLKELNFSTAEANGNPDVLRPGLRATKTIFVRANSTATISLQVFAIRKQY